jgi:hypothetical protein
MAGNDNYFLLLSIFFLIDMVLKLFLVHILFEVRAGKHVVQVCNYYDICQGNPCAYKKKCHSENLSSCKRRRIMGVHWQVGQTHAAG